jgi:2-dehydro-3-deoxy-L-rhamnonate dehydrogenase (NAD+)
MNRIDLNDRIAIVTGAARGLGLAITERLLESGASVSMWDLDGAALEREATRLGTKTRIHTATVDVTDEGQVEAAAKSAHAAFGRVDILVNNAGIAGPVLRSW